MSLRSRYGCSEMTAPAQAAGGGIPILGPLSTPARGRHRRDGADRGRGDRPRIRRSTPTRRSSSSSPRPGSWASPGSSASRPSASGRSPVPQVGGILNATFGNIAELIIAFFALQAGLIEVVKASITGSIIGNLLLVLGASVLLGGLRTAPSDSAGDRRRERCAAGARRDRPVRSGRVRAIDGEPTEGDLVEESVLVALLLMVGYVISLVFQFTNP